MQTFHSKKRRGRPQVTTAAATSSPHNLGFHIKDEITGTLFLVDTGAFCSVYPAAPHERHIVDTDPLLLTAANGTAISSHGTKDIRLQFNSRKYTWSFRLAQVSQPLLGSDFLAQHNLLVDVARRRLISADTFNYVQLQTNTDPVHQLNVCSTPNEKYSGIITEYAEVFKPELRQQHTAKPKHGIFHHIPTTGPPVHSRFRRLNPQKLAAAKSAFNEMESMGICAKASSPWASPLHMVTKQDGSWRPCGDYRRLNLISVPDQYPMPNITDLTNNIGNARIFTKLDLLKGYFQVPVHPEDVPKTAIITPFGSYVFYYSTFGLRNSGATFQRLMDSIFGQTSNCLVYIDDLLVFSDTPEEHKQHLRTVLSKLQANGLIVRPDKCVFGAQEVDFLGHRITANGILPLPSKVSAIKNYPIPSTIKELQSFLGLVNYYHRFIPMAADKMTDLHSTLSGKPKQLKWGPEQQAAFQLVKNSLTAATALAYPLPGDTLTLTTDASDKAIGAVLQTVHNDIPRPIGFYSRSLHVSERNYSTFDRELLAVHQAIRHFRHLLEGTPFIIQTDHRPLVTALTKSTDAWSARQQRHLSAIAESGGTLTYLPGSHNPVADALSRIILEVHPGINYNQLAQEQRLDPEIADYETSITNLQWEKVQLNDTTVLCDVSTGRPRPLVPTKLRRMVFNVVHGLAHPSIKSTVKLIKSKFVWYAMEKDIRLWAQACDACQRNKTHRHIKTPIGKFPQPSRRFAQIHVDIVGPLPQSEGYRYLFTITDRATRWPEATPIYDETAESCAGALLTSWVARFGLPEHITSDRGGAFISNLWTNLALLLGIQLHHTTAYHPQSNGMIERWHRTLKTSLMSRCTGSDWIHHLPWVLLGLRTTPKEGINISAAEMVFGQPLVVPGEFFPCYTNPTDPTHTDLQAARWAARQFTPCLPTHPTHRDTYIPKSLQSTDYVFVRQDLVKPALSPPYRGPYRIVQRSDKAYLLDIHGKQDWVTLDRLKPAYVEPMDYVTHTRTGRQSRPPHRLGL